MSKRYVVIGRQLYDKKDDVTKALFNSSDPDTWQEIVDKLNAHIEPELWERVVNLLKDVVDYDKYYVLATLEDGWLRDIHYETEAILKEIDA